MSIERLPGGGYKVRWRVGAHATGYVHHAKTFKKGERRLADQFEQEINRAKRLGYLPQLEASKRTIGEVAAEWWVAQEPNLAPRTRDLYDQLLQGHVLPEFDSLRLGEVGVAEIEGWLADLDTGPNAKRNALGILSRIFNYALRAGYVQGNPCNVVVKPKLPDKEPINPPAPLEVERIRAALFALERPGDAYMVGFMAYAGPRSQELRDLDWTDVQARTVLLRSSKTGRARAVKLVEPLLEDLALWRQASGVHKLSGPVFPTSTGKRFTKFTWDNWRKRIWTDVAPKGMRPYDLRHTFVSLLLRDPNVPRVEAAEQAGHSLQVQSDTYAHLFAELEGQGSAESAIRSARAEVYGTTNADGQIVGA